MNMTSEGHITYQTQGRYFVLGEPAEGKSLLVALHGYGYLAQYFIRKFQGVDLNRFVVVCPEGPHRFYQNGTNGRVGASWMTKEDRLTDISNYLNFLDALLDHLKAQYDYKSVTLLGFSQGGATACRWLAFGKHQFDKFILWATVFPPDMEPEYCEKFNHSKNYFVFGTKDEYYNIETIHEHFKELERLCIPFEMLNFDGNHNIDETTLLSVLND